MGVSRGCRHDDVIFRQVGLDVDKVAVSRFPPEQRPLFPNRVVAAAVKALNAEDVKGAFRRLQAIATIRLGEQILK